jgi:hypothetical protein
MLAFRTMWLLSPLPMNFTVSSWWWLMLITVCKRWALLSCSSLVLVPLHPSLKAWGVYPQVTVGASIRYLVFFMLLSIHFWV